MRSKQKTLHGAAGNSALIAFCSALWVFCTALPIASGAQEIVTGPQGEQMASMRLIAAPGRTNGRYAAGIDIAMEPGAHTYWKQPGDAGVPPVFSFNGSINAAQAEVVFPLPSRLVEEGLEAFGYTQEVVFPVLVTPKDPAKPVILKADVTYAVCQKICVPGHGTATLTLPPKAGDAGAAKVEAALAEVPIPMSPDLRRDLSIEPVKGADKPTWTLKWGGRNALADIFAVAPEGFYFETKRTGPDRFSLIAAQVVTAAGTTHVPVSLVLALAPHGVVTAETFDVTGSTN